MNKNQHVQSLSNRTDLEETMYDQQAELDATYCDICGHHHSPDCYDAQWEEN